MIANSGNLVKPERTRHFILYEPESGIIRHVHSVLTFAGAHPASEELHWERAKKIAEKLGGKDRILERVVIDGPERPSGHHKVDPKTRTLVRA